MYLEFFQLAEIQSYALYPETVLENKSIEDAKLSLGKINALSKTKQ